MGNIHVRGVSRLAKQQKTNAMRILEQKKLPHRVNFYECDEFTDAVQIAEMLGQDPEQTFKTLMCVGKSGEHYAFVMQGTAEMDLKKAAAAAGEKSVQLLPVKEILAVTGYMTAKTPEEAEFWSEVYRRTEPLLQGYYGHDGK